MHCCSKCPWPMLLPEIPRHSQASLGQSLVGSLLLSSGSWCAQGLFVPSRCLFLKSYVSYVGFNGDLIQECLCHTQVWCTQSPCPWGRPLLTWTSAGDTQTHRSGSVFVGSLGPGVHEVCLSPWVSFEGMGFESKHDFTPPTIFLWLLICPWTWGIFFWWDPTFSCQPWFSS